MGYDWDFDAIWPFLPAIWKGIWVTVELTVIVIIAGTIVGFPLGLLLRVRLRPARWIVTLAVDVVRSLPVLVLLLAAYYILPELVGYRNMPPFVIAAIALGMNLAVFVADVVRGAVANVPRDYIDAACSVGLTRWQILRRVVVPFVLRTTLPTLALLYIAMLKLSSLASVITVPELTHAADLVKAQTYRALEVWSVVAIIYIVLVLPFSLLARRLEIRGGFERFNA